eukprot:Awhi_evm1s6110
MKDEHKKVLLAFDLFYFKECCRDENHDNHDSEDSDDSDGNGDDDACSEIAFCVQCLDEIKAKLRLALGNSFEDL